MNQQERDELRAKHRVGQNEADDQCQSCFSADCYPCDVIKVLDALESRNGLVSPAQMYTTEYPPEGQNEECPHNEVEKLC